jgi:Icc-related predicted phosphoesterase
VRILIVSDLHHELWRDQAPTIDPAISRPDIIVLAGDINTGSKAVGWAATTFPGLPVLYVHGNHEAYGRNLEDTQAEIRAACEATRNVHFLDCDEYILGNVRFLGATLWTDFRLFGDDERAAAMREAEAVMTDYKRIRLAEKRYRKLRSADTARFHSLHRTWLTEKLNEPFAGTTVVITHMAPSLRSVAERFSSDLTSASYASRLDSLVEKADLWIHGHMHDSFDYCIGACRVVCNPCGYKTRDGRPENEEFDSGFVVELPK